MPRSGGTARFKELLDRRLNKYPARQALLKQSVLEALSECSLPFPGIGYVSFLVKLNGIKVAGISLVATCISVG
jgi:hypothetical protein